jgi:hypothetical protein
MAIACLGLFALCFPSFIWRISFSTICFAFGPYLREVPEAERRALEVRGATAVVFDGRVVAEAVVRVERRVEAVLLRVRAAAVRRVPAVTPARRVREREVEAAATRDELARRRAVAEREDAERRRPLLAARFLACVADARAGRELDLRLLVAIV